jgi:hypothetical protein
LPESRHSLSSQSPLERITEEIDVPDIRQEHDPTDKVLQQLIESGELDMLTRMQRLEMAHCPDGIDQLVNRRGRNETVLDYEARMALTARARVIAEIRAGISAADLFDRLSPYRRQT